MEETESIQFDEISINFTSDVNSSNGEIVVKAVTGAGLFNNQLIKSAFPYAAYGEVRLQWIISKQGRLPGIGD